MTLKILCERNIHQHRIGIFPRIGILKIPAAGYGTEIHHPLAGFTISIERHPTRRHLIPANRLIVFDINTDRTILPGRYHPIQSIYPNGIRRLRTPPIQSPTLRRFRIARISQTNFILRICNCSGKHIAVRCYGNYRNCGTSIGSTDDRTPAPASGHRQYFL